MKIVIELPSKNEALITVITMALFLLLTDPLFPADPVFFLPSG
jgi:hypothetical protein